MEMNNKQPEALRLADICSKGHSYDVDLGACETELRRLHARIVELENENSYLNDACAELEARVQELEAKEVNIEEFRVITTEAVRMPLLNRIRELETANVQRVPMLFNPFNGKPRHPLDVQSDPYGLLITAPNADLRAAPITQQNKLLD